MVNDVAKKDLTPESGTIPPDALFTFVYNDIMYCITYEALAQAIAGA